MSIYQSLIDYFGGQRATAKALNCKQPSVWAWAQGKTNMSATLAIKAEIITNGKFKAVDLCPKLTEVTNTVSANDAGNSPDQA